MMDNLISETTNRIFADLGHDPCALWTALEDNLLTRACIPEDLGGAGLSLCDGFGVIQIAASYGVAVPFAETVMAGYILSIAEIEPPNGKISLYQKNSLEVPFGDNADFICRVSGNCVELYDAAKCESVPSVGSDPIASIDLDNFTPTLKSQNARWLNDDTYHQICALGRAAQMKGCMEAVLNFTLEFVGEREQFGRPLSKFQAIQNLLASMAGEVASSAALVDAAVETLDFDTAPNFRLVASAKIRTSESADVVAANAHQSHGAIGYTEEYKLGEYTRRLWRWREDFGNETYWARRLGEDFVRGESLITEVFGG